MLRAAAKAARRAGFEDRRASVSAAQDLTGLRAAATARTLTAPPTSTWSEQHQHTGMACTQAKGLPPTTHRFLRAQVPGRPVVAGVSVGRIVASGMTCSVITSKVARARSTDPGGG